MSYRCLPLMFLSAAALFGATIPSDPLELATGLLQNADTSALRADALALLERARQNQNLHVWGGPPFDLKVSFTSSGAVSNTGSGDIEEIWMTPGTWLWTAHVGNYSQTRVYYQGQAFDTNPGAYMPLRMHTVRSAIFWPVPTQMAGSLLRTSPASYNGVEVTCILTSRGSSAKDTSGRQWNEREYCVDPKTGFLQTYSEVPGIYSSYDYNGALEFHGSTLPRRFSIFEGGVPVIQAEIGSIQDPPASRPEAFTPSADMKGPGVMIQGHVHLLHVVPGTEPAVVHALLDQQGKVLEAELVQSGNSSEGAGILENVKSAIFPAAREDVPTQREVFIRVVGSLQ